MNVETLKEVRAELPRLMEMVGTLCGQVCDAVTDAQAGNGPMALLVVQDTQTTFQELEAKLTDMGVKLARWELEEGGGL